MNRTVTPSVLAERIQQKTGIDKDTAKKFSFAFFDLVKFRLKREPVVVIHKFGTFRKIFVEAGLKRNPRTNQLIEIPAHYKIRFTPSKSLASRLNAKYAHLRAKALKLKKEAAGNRGYETPKFFENEKFANASQISKISRSAVAAENPDQGNPAQKVNERHTPEQLLTQNMQELCGTTEPQKKHGKLGAAISAALLILLCALLLLAIKMIGLPDFLTSKKKKNGNAGIFSDKNPVLEKVEESESRDMVSSSSEKSMQAEDAAPQEIKDFQEPQLMQEFEVPQGFCYYKIAEQKLGNRHLWPVIFAENVSSSLTDGIPNPDFVRANSKIFIPVPDENENEKKEFSAYWKDAYLKTYNAYYNLMEAQPDSPRNSLRQFRAARVLVSAEIIFPGFLQENKEIVKAQDFQDALKIFKNHVP